MMTAQSHHPVSAIIAWLAELPPENRRTIGLLFLSTLPGYREPNDGDVLTDAYPPLLEWLDSHQNDRDAVGKALVFRAIVDFQCQTLFSSSTGSFVASIQRARDLGRDALADQMEETLPRRQLEDARWLRVAETWRDLCASHISDSSLKTYEFESLRRMR
jgi:hypothetical protein